MDDALALVAALPLAVLLGVVLVVMILAARLGGWLRERWTKRGPRRERRHEGEGW
jgi:Flp pilus assembly pilin Flp